VANEPIVFESTVVITVQFILRVVYMCVCTCLEGWCIAVKSLYGLGLFFWSGVFDFKNFRLIHRFDTSSWNSNADWVDGVAIHMLTVT